METPASTAKASAPTSTVKAASTAAAVIRKRGDGRKGKQYCKYGSEIQ